MFAERKKSAYIGPPVDPEELAQALEKDFNVKTPGPSVRPSLINGSYQVNSGLVGDWNVYMSPSPDQVNDYLSVLNNSLDVMTRAMFERKFKPESVAWSVRWAKQRFIDRAIISRESYLSAPFCSVRRLHELELAALKGNANPAQRLLVRYGIGAKNVELARVTNPEQRDAVLESKRRAIDTSIHLLGGTALSAKPEFEVEELEALRTGQTLVRVHKKEILALMPDGVKVARRIAYVAQLAGAISAEEFDPEVLANVQFPVIQQSEVDYAYTKDGLVSDWYLGIRQE